MNFFKNCLTLHTVYNTINKQKRKVRFIMDKDTLIKEIKELIITSLDLEDLTPADIETSAPLFGDGLGLDSIDALELGMALKSKYGIEFKSTKEENKEYFKSVESLTDFIIKNKN